MSNVTFENHNHFVSFLLLVMPFLFISLILKGGPQKFWSIQKFQLQLSCQRYVWVIFIFWRMAVNYLSNFVAMIDWLVLARYRAASMLSTITIPSSAHWMESCHTTGTGVQAHFPPFWTFTDRTEPHCAVGTTCSRWVLMVNSPVSALEHSASLALLHGCQLLLRLKTG